MPKLCLISLGCTKNLVDSEVMLGALSRYERTNEPQNADIIIINTCGFIASAKKESIDRILEVAYLKKDDAILIVSGCLSERYAEELRDEIKEIDIITGVGDYDKIESMIKRVRDSRKMRNESSLRGVENAEAIHKSKLDCHDLPQASLAMTQKTPQILKSDKTFLIDNEQRIITGSAIHAYIKISEGCNQQCSFCAIPHFKGKLHSRGIDSIMREVDSLVARGYADFSFIAQDSSSYMRDLGKKDGLVELIKRVENSGAKSARILYLYPTTTSESLIHAIADSRVFQNYFDMPLQHISDKMLRAMKRGADKARHIALLEQMRGCENSFVRTTFLLGHPQESERDFAELCEFVSDFSFERANIFGFSREEGTVAFDMSGEVSAKTTKERIKTLNAILSKQQKNSLKSLVGKEIVAIIEGRSTQSDLLFSARDLRWDREIDGEILINDSAIPLNSGYYKVQITDFKGGILLGKAIAKI